MAETAASKTCAICGEDVSARPRTKDARGRYFCKACYQGATARRQETTLRHTPRADDGEYGLEPAAITPARARPTSAGPAPASASRSPGRGGAHAALRRPVSPATGPESPNPSAAPRSCPSCEAALDADTVVCVPCGINVVSGRSILTAEQGDTERTYEQARGILWFASWLMLIGLMPISSEAHGSRTPWMLRSLALLTVLATMGMWWFEWTDSSAMRTLKSQFLWAGQAEPDSDHIEMFYAGTAFGDRKAFARMKHELHEEAPPEELAAAALSRLPPSKRCFGEFRIWQLLTHAFLHADFLHLAGNLVFMLVFDSRINALIGNAGTLLVYPLLAVVAALPQIAAMSHEMPTTMLGASGAIMGLAGMYFVLFPISPVHVAAFVRVPILLLGFFKCRGFWILLFYIAFDVLFTVLQSEDGTAHWAHMGGFIAGMLIALGLLAARGVNARGNDLLSVLLGRRAWNVIGKPSQWRHISEGEGWMTRWRLTPSVT